MTIDLHMHSNISLDGEFQPKQLAALCRKKGLHTAALTDHNSVRGVEEFCKAAKNEGIHPVRGIEIDCTCEDVNLHLLGYQIDISDRRYRDMEEEILEQKRESSGEEMKIIQELGIYYEEAEVRKLSKEGIVVGEMIAEAALQDVRNEKNPLLQPYRRGGSRENNPYVNFFWDFFSQGKPAYIPVRYPSFQEALKLITETGGFAVIAHPVNTVEKREKMISGMIREGAAGIEVFCSYHTPEDVIYYKKLADTCHVIKTCGSDFHGKTKPSVYLGDISGATQKDEEALACFIQSLA